MMASEFGKKGTIQSPVKEATRAAGLALSRKGFFVQQATVVSEEPTVHWVI